MDLGARKLSIREVVKKGLVQEWKNLMEKVHNKSYAKIILNYGKVDEYVVVDMEEENLKASLKNQTCISCSEKINQKEKKNCLFTKDGDQPIFYMCRKCQK